MKNVARCSVFFVLRLEWTLLNNDYGSLGGMFSYKNSFLITQPHIPGPVIHHQTAESPWLILFILDELLLSYAFVQVHKHNVNMKMKKLKKKMEMKGKVFDLEVFKDKKIIFEEVILSSCCISIYNWYEFYQKKMARKAKEEAYLEVFSC